MQTTIRGYLGVEYFSRFSWKHRDEFADNSSYQTHPWTTPSRLQLLPVPGDSAPLQRAHAAVLLLNAHVLQIAHKSGYRRTDAVGGKGGEGVGVNANLQREAGNAPLPKRAEGQLHRGVVQQPGADQQTLWHHLQALMLCGRPTCRVRVAVRTLQRIVWAMDGRASAIAGCSSDEHACAMLMPLANCEVMF